MLIQAPKLDHQIMASYIEKQVFSSITLTEKKALGASIVDTPRPLFLHKPAKGEKAEFSAFPLASFAILTKRMLEAVHFFKATLEAGAPNARNESRYPLKLAHSTRPLVTYTLFTDFKG